MYWSLAGLRNFSCPFTLLDGNLNQPCAFSLQDEKFGKLFRAYAKKVNLSVADLTFAFDGDKVDAESTPEDLGLEDEDMVEVLHKTR